jgi:hypothetical protein
MFTNFPRMSGNFLGKLGTFRGKFSNFRRKFGNINGKFGNFPEKLGHFPGKFRNIPGTEAIILANYFILELILSFVFAHILVFPLFRPQVREKNDVADRVAVG